MPVNTIISLRKGTSSTWTSTNPVLASGEPGFDITNKTLKIGDGISNWNSLSSHNHSSSDITNFSSSVSGLLPVKNISGSGYISITSSSGDYTIVATGLQPSGNYSTVGHTHSSSDISDFNSSVSGLFPTGQIVFPATANLSADANTLDDYEEGTWTPTFIGSTTNPTVNYSASTYGHYTKIGKVVVLQGRIILTAASGGSGELRIAGLPFGPSSGAVQQAVSVGTRVNFTTQAPNQCYLHATVAQLRLAFFTATGATFNTPANLAANSDITFGGVYMTDA